MTHCADSPFVSDLGVDEPPRLGVVVTSRSLCIASVFRFVLTKPSIDDGRGLTSTTTPPNLPFQIIPIASVFLPCGASKGQRRQQGKMEVCGVVEAR